MTEQLTGTIIDQGGAPVAAATIAVRDDAGALVTLTDADGSAEANPTTTNSEGLYDVQVPAAGTYYLTVTKGQASLVLTKTAATTVTVITQKPALSAAGPMAVAAKIYTEITDTVLAVTNAP